MSFPLFFPRSAIAALFLCPALLTAEIVCDFSSEAAFPGTVGEGWRGPWEGRRYLPDNPKNKKYQRTLDGVTVIKEGEKPVLRVEPRPQESDLGAGVARAYASFGDLDLTKAYTISCTVRFERLPKNKKRSSLRNQFFFIGENATSAVGVTGGTSWFLQAYYGPKPGAPVASRAPNDQKQNAQQRHWSVGSQGDDGEFAYVPTDVAIQEGQDYQLEIGFDPASSTYTCTIVSGSTRFSSEPLKLNTQRPLGEHLVFGSRHLAEDPAVFSVGEIHIRRK